jgi:CBS domain-containing protein
MKVKDLCVCDVAACTRSTSIARAGSLMQKYDVGALPIVDRSERVIGMVTDRDIALELTRRNAPASEITVEEVMSDGVVGTRADVDVRDALRLMATHGVRRLPVLDEDGLLEGVISIDDIICHSVEDEGGQELSYADVMETLEEISRDYRAESGSKPQGRRYREDRPVRPEVTSGRRSRGRYYRSESPRFEEEAHAGRPRRRR